MLVIIQDHYTFEYSIEDDGRQAHDRRFESTRVA